MGIECLPAAAGALVREDAPPRKIHPDQHDRLARVGAVVHVVQVAHATRIQRVHRGAHRRPRQRKPKISGSLLTFAVESRYDISYSHSPALPIESSLVTFLPSK